MIQIISRFCLFSIVVLMMSCLGIVGCGKKKIKDSDGIYVSPVQREMPKREMPKPDAILRVGDKFPIFSDEDVRKSVFDIYISQRSDINGKIGGTLQLQNGYMILKDGTVYKAPGKCIIDYSKGSIITEGTIEVYYNTERAILGVPLGIPSEQFEPKPEPEPEPEP